MIFVSTFSTSSKVSKLLSLLTSLRRYCSHSCGDILDSCSSLMASSLTFLKYCRQTWIRIVLLGLPEGYWTNGKTANEALSMIDISWKCCSVSKAYCNQLHTLKFHCDYYDDQSKNRWVPWHSYVQAFQWYRLVTLWFLIKCQTKSHYVDSFGILKQLLRTGDVNDP